MLLTHDDIRLLLDVLARTAPGGVGYSKDPAVARIQSKLSIMLEVTRPVATGTKEAPDGGRTA